MRVCNKWCPTEPTEMSYILSPLKYPFKDKIQDKWNMAKNFPKTSISTDDIKDIC